MRMIRRSSWHYRLINFYRNTPEGHKPREAVTTCQYYELLSAAIAVTIVMSPLFLLFGIVMNMIWLVQHAPWPKWFRSWLAIDHEKEERHRLEREAKKARKRVATIKRYEDGDGRPMCQLIEYVD